MFIRMESKVLQPLLPEVNCADDMLAPPTGRASRHIGLYFQNHAGAPT